ncbi:MAG TPA: hypothetical protein VF131_12640 [Blastocatellia bacterium]|nr:hypothetical protein [Blastocatellia bacterium]
MKQTSYDRRLLIEYLLHKLSEEEEVQLEEKYFVDPEFHRQLQEAERDLIDMYARNELAGKEKERFEKYFLPSPRRQERIEFARALAESVSRTAGVKGEGYTIPGAASWWQSLPAYMRANSRVVALSAVILITVFGLWLAFALLNKSEQGQERQVVQTQDSLPDSENQPAGATPQPEPKEESDKTPRSKDVPRIATYALSPYLTRDISEVKEIIIAPEIDTVRLQLYVEGDLHKSYGAVLATPEGRKIWEQDRLKGKPANSGAVVVLMLPAKILTSRDYVLSLKGTNGDEREDVGKYYFRAVKQ